MFSFLKLYIVLLTPYEFHSVTRDRHFKFVLAEMSKTRHGLVFSSLIALVFVSLGVSVVSDCM